jgi:hypothetical protein
VGAVRAALLRQRPAVVVPSPAAVERVLWLAAVDRCLRCGPRDADEVRAAYRDLRALIDRAAPSLYAQTPIAAVRESRWLVAARGALPEGTPAERAATVVWAAVGAWTDAPSGRWGDLADAAADLGDWLDVGGVVVPRRASALRETMVDVWRTMEAGR